MTPAQEQAASAARKACTWRLRSGPKSGAELAMWDEWSLYSRRLAPETTFMEYEEIKKAYLTAWRTTWETA